MAKGVRGLHFGGRAGLAKKNLASLAPDGLPGSSRYARDGLEALDTEHTQRIRGNKRPAEVYDDRPVREQSETLGRGMESGGEGSATPRPSKLAARAAARQPGGANAAASSPSLLDAPGQGKPLSKLQQKMQANLLARQHKKQITPSKEEQELHSQRQEEEVRSMALLLPTGEPITSLFPSEPGLAGPDGRPCSSFSSVLKDESAPDLAVPGGSPFLSVQCSDAFSQPSPDDVVLRAREGTNLARG